MWKSRIFFLVGSWILVFSGLQLFPLIHALAIKDEIASGGLTISLVVSSLVGGSLFLGFRSVDKIRVPRLTIFLPLLGVPILSVVAGLPLFILFPEQGFLAAIYDGMSQITTNGSSAFEDGIADMPSLLLWRAITSWLGGIIAVSFTLSLLMALNSGALQLHQSPLFFGERETGYQRLSAITSKVLPIYAGATAICVVLLVLVGNTVFDSIVLALSILSTSGGTPEHMVLGQGPIAQIIIVVFLFLSMSNWDVHHLRVRTKTTALKQDRELRMSFILCVFIMILLALLTNDLESWITPLFASVSAISTFGIVPESMRLDESNLPIAIILMVSAAIGGAIASTTGGLKQMRVLLISRMGRAEINRLAHPNGVHTVHYGKAIASPTDIEAVWLLIGSFVFIMALGATALAILGLSFQEALALAFSAMTLSGPLAYAADPSFPGYGSLNQADYFILSWLMLIGRLEASLFMALFAKALWRG